jgi:hypothetical protein
MAARDYAELVIIHHELQVLYLTGLIGLFLLAGIWSMAIRGHK